jgi:pyrroline-5-carboxylate reductase
LSRQLGIIGGGNMAEAIVRGALDASVLTAKNMIIADPSEQRRELFAKLGITVTDRNTEAISDSRAVLLAVKPQVFPKILDDLRAIDPAKQCVISIMAGISIATLTEVTGGSQRVIRTMPNTPLLAGKGMTGIAPGPGVTDDDRAFAESLFACAGEAVFVEEPMIDVVTAVSGSGPAYIFYLAEAMAEAAKNLGMTDEQADRFSRQTVLGAATLLSEAEESAAELRRRVCSPGGTTLAAIEHMEARQVRQSIVEAVGKARDRSVELGS